MSESEDRLIDALRLIMSYAPTSEPEEENYDDTESAYNNGQEVAWWQAKSIAAVALHQAKVIRGRKA